MGGPVQGLARRPPLIQALHVAGDFVDLQGFPLKKQDHGVGALTPGKVALVPHQALCEITDNHPHLTRPLWANTLIEAAIHRQWLVGLGRQSAIEHAAHLLRELLIRLQVIGQAADRTFQLPMT
ncbi:hypothetical protein [Microvirga makkahensis]|uniref:Uncharacterized protein n=1 Tax=Microvirga makkahensis TaxID=1128670 RepID=A0A7X3MX54_9HYPH|nr:hypothetical protein [Microvirga makkahensis]MXQ14814.1 hypothetical protein [Microvirga makkahensis]